MDTIKKLMRIFALDSDNTILKIGSKLWASFISISLIDIKI